MQHLSCAAALFIAAWSVLPSSTVAAQGLAASAADPVGTTLFLPLISTEAVPSAPGPTAEQVKYSQLQAELAGGLSVLISEADGYRATFANFQSAEQDNQTPRTTLLTKI